MARYTPEGRLGAVIVRGSALSGDVVEAVTDASIDLSTTAVGQLELSLSDPDLYLLASGLFVAATATRSGTRVDYLDLRFEVAAIETTPDAGGTLKVTCRETGPQLMRRARGALTRSGLSPTEFMAAEAAANGLGFVGQPSARRDTVARTTASTDGGGTDESSWDVGQRLAEELGYLCFAAARVLYFASPTWLVARGEAERISTPWAGAATPPWVITRPSCRRSGDDAANAATAEVSLTSEVGELVRPGWAHDIFGLPTFDGRYLVTSVKIPLDDAAPVAINSATPIDPEPKPPAPPEKAPGEEKAAAAAVETVKASGTSGGKSAGEFVRICLAQTGKRYIYGAEVSASNANPNAFDCCVTIDSMISTVGRGPVRIADVEPGEQVWTWDDGHLSAHEVVAVAAQPVQPVFAVRTRTSTVRASANHPFLVARRSERQRDAAGGWLPVAWRTEWARLDELERGDLLVHLEREPDRWRHSAVLPDGTPITADVAWLIGQFLADGHIDRGGVRIAAYGHDEEIRERIATVVESTWGVIPAFHPTAGVIISSAVLRDVFTDFGLHEHAQDKNLPEALLALPAEATRALLAGYAAGDGHLDKRGHQSYTSASRVLLDQVRGLHRALGDRVSNVTTNHRTKPIVIKGVQVQRALPLHSFAVYPDSTRRNTTILDVYGARRALPDTAFTVERVVSITPDGEEATFDLQIEGAHNYVVDGAVVHNSELVEWACARVGVRFPDGTDAQQRAVKRISVEQAIGTRGALLFHPGHVAVSLGNGRTIEAANSRTGVVQNPARGRFSAAGLIPGLSY